MFLLDGLLHSNRKIYAFQIGSNDSPHPRELDVVKATRSDSVELRQVADCRRIQTLSKHSNAVFKVPALQNKN